MKCPYCKEELGLNNICINPSCSHFSSSFDNNTCETNDSKDKNNISVNISDSHNDDSYSEYSDTNNSSANDFSFNPSIISDEEFENIISKKNRDYYMNNLQKYKEKKKFTSWNWPCFFFGPYWMLYRKMFALGFAYLLLDFIIDLSIDEPIALALRIVLSVFANAIYLHHCEKKIRKVKRNYDMQNPSYYDSLRKKGGTSIIIPIISTLIVSMISISVFFLDLIDIDDIQYDDPYDTPVHQFEDYYF